MKNKILTCLFFLAFSTSALADIHWVISPLDTKLEPHYIKTTEPIFPINFKNDSNVKEENGLLVNLSGAMINITDRALDHFGFSKKEMYDLISKHAKSTDTRLTFEATFANKSDNKVYWITNLRINKK